MTPEQEKRLGELVKTMKAANRDYDEKLRQLSAADAKRQYAKWQVQRYVKHTILGEPIK